MKIFLIVLLHLLAIGGCVSALAKQNDGVMVGVLAGLIILLVHNVVGEIMRYLE